MLQWCVDNSVTMEVSLSNEVWLNLHFSVWCYHTVAYALREHGGHHGVMNFNLDDISCTGNEMRLVDCFQSGVGNHNCKRGRKEAAVICTGQLSILKSEYDFVIMTLIHSLGSE